MRQEIQAKLKPAGIFFKNEIIECKMFNIPGIASHQSILCTVMLNKCIKKLYSMQWHQKENLKITWLILKYVLLVWLVICYCYAMYKKEKLFYSVEIKHKIKVCVTPTCLHSLQLASFKLQILFLWTLVVPQTPTSKSCSCLTRKRSMIPKCTKKLWTRFSMRHLCSRLVLLCTCVVGSFVIKEEHILSCSCLINALANTA